MRRILVGLAAVAGLIACNPVYNWREARLAQATIKIMLPCKPDHGSRQMMLAGQSAEIQMIGCEADGALFAVAQAKLFDEASARVGLEQWKKFALDNMQTSTSTMGAYAVKGAGTVSPGVLLKAKGRGESGETIELQALWWVRGAQLYYAAVYGVKLNQEAVENFLTGIELQ